MKPKTIRILIGLWAVVAIPAAILLQSPRFLESLFPHKKWLLTHVLSQDYNTKTKLNYLLSRAPANDFIEQVYVAEASMVDLQKLKSKGYKILSVEEKNKALLANSAIDFFMVTSHDGKPVFSGPYQGLEAELKLARSFLGRARLAFYAGFSCNQNIKLQSLLNPQQNLTNQ